MRGEFLLKDIELITLFLAYVTIADEHIDNQEVRVINEFIKENDIGELKAEVELIFSDSDEKKTLDSILKELSKLQTNIQEQALISGLSLAYINNFFDPAQEQLFDKFLDVMSFDQDRFLEIKTQVMKFDKKIEGGVANDSNPLLQWSLPVFRPLIKKLTQVAPSQIKEKMEKLETKMLLAGPEYDEAIFKCARIANEDYYFVSKYIEDTSDAFRALTNKVEETIKFLEKKERQDSEFDVTGVLKEFESSVKKVILEELKNNKKSLQKKRRAMQSYTISFIGKTKAGKSTLHSVITGESNESIGVGKQRTTLFNRVYKWKNIRIIDTPGIGAPHGKTEEEIAKGVVDESDVICYVVKNDSIQEAEFKVLQHIRDKNKPVIILLNVKENIEHPTRFKLYLNDPHKWYKRKDAKSLEGHFNRIKGYAEKYYANNYLKVYPVQVLAAKMSRDKRYNEHAKVLYKSSRMEDFLDAVRVAIIDEGIIKRSQTILDGTIQNVNGNLTSINNLLEPLVELRDKIESKLKQIPEDLERKHQDNVKQIKSTINTEFDNLLEYAYTFATENYDYDRDEIEERWEKYLNSIQFSEKLESSIRKSFEEYGVRVKGYFEELAEDLTIFQNLKLQDINFETKSTFSFRTLAHVGSILAGLGTAIAAFLSGPWGWFFVAHIGFEMSKELFKSRERKKREAIETIYYSLKDSIDSQKEKMLNNFPKEIKKIHKKVKSNVVEYFSILNESLDAIIQEIDPVKEQLSHQIWQLNKGYAWRVLNYINSKSVYKIDMEAADEEVIKVERELGKVFKIVTYGTVDQQTNNKVSEILQEKVIIDRSGNG